ncbi:hypothetical protein FA15DRAFT_709166 [Coprinopsis marcescibilis]|uniref:Uncharacterized protein n=1 Tax=Coprinopsis marcescibilis TaxID=230819 RepID=A0A5C3KGD3_COPMA|nr:hypothetical protein FA15DRAFT_709166 [Coprinopsis marcescibilis]
MTIVLIIDGFPSLPLLFPLSAPYPVASNLHSFPIDSIDSIAPFKPPTSYALPGHHLARIVVVCGILQPTSDFATFLAGSDGVSRSLEQHEIALKGGLPIQIEYQSFSVTSNPPVVNDYDYNSQPTFEDLFNFNELPSFSDTPQEDDNADGHALAAAPQNEELQHQELYQNNWSAANDPEDNKNIAAEHQSHGSVTGEEQKATDIYAQYVVDQPNKAKAIENDQPQAASKEEHQIAAPEVSASLNIGHVPLSIYQAQSQFGASCNAPPSYLEPLDRDEAPSHKRMRYDSYHATQEGSFPINPALQAHYASLVDQFNARQPSHEHYEIQASASGHQIVAPSVDPVLVAPFPGHYRTQAIQGGAWSSYPDQSQIRQSPSYGSQDAFASYTEGPAMGTTHYPHFAANLQGELGENSPCRSQDFQYAIASPSSFEAVVFAPAQPPGSKRKRSKAAAQQQTSHYMANTHYECPEFCALDHHSVPAISGQLTVHAAPKQSKPRLRAVAKPKAPTVRRRQVFDLTKLSDVHVEPVYIGPNRISWHGFPQKCCWDHDNNGNEECEEQIMNHKHLLQHIQDHLDKLYRELGFGNLVPPDRPIVCMYNRCYAKVVFRSLGVHFNSHGKGNCSLRPGNEICTVPVFPVEATAQLGRTSDQSTIQPATQPTAQTSDPQAALQEAAI